MAMSEREQKELDELGRELDASDPQFARLMKLGFARKWLNPHVLLGLLIAAAGVILLLLGVSLQAIPWGVAGFLVMIGGVDYADGSKQLAGGTVKFGKVEAIFFSYLKHRWAETMHS